MGIVGNAFIMAKVALETIPQPLIGVVELG
jgi:hypothetical protein